MKGVIEIDVSPINEPVSEKDLKAHLRAMIEERATIYDRDTHVYGSWETKGHLDVTVTTKIEE